MSAAETEIEVTVGAPPERDITVAFPGGGLRRSAWITVDPGDGRPLCSLRVASTGDGIAVELLPYDRELEPPLASFFVHDEELAEGGAGA